MDTIIIDGAAMTTRDAAHSHLALRLGLPDYYGRNLDALFDCLTDRREAMTVRLLHREALEDRLGRRGAAMVRLLRRAAEENPAVTLLEAEN